MKKPVVVSGIAAIAIIGGLAACHSSTSAAVSTAPAVSSSAPAVTTAPAAKSAPAVTTAPAAKSAPATTSVPAVASTSAPAMTTAQQQAVDAAKGYLSMGSGFSQESLLQQLTSSAGNGFTETQAEYAVSKVGL